jgi:2-octaprenyl-6-methoxyphenol hydroxylase
MGGSANLDRPGRNPHPAAMAEIRAELSIVGGGLNGLTLGIACAGAGIETAIIDRENPSRMTAPGFDGRTSAIAFGSKRVLEAVGVWPRLAGRAEAIREIRVADAGAPLFLHYDHREIGADPFGWIVENRDLRAALYARAAELPALRLIAPASVAEARREPAGTTLALADGGTVRSQLIAAADGKDSALRQAAGIRVAAWAYPQLAIVATIRHERPHHGVAVEHFLPAGPFAILPMTGNRSSIVWTERAALAPKLAALPDDAFRAELGARFGDFLGALEFEGPRWTYPLAFLHAERMVAPRLALIGEAAHLIHPIAGQGLNLGIRDGAALAECLVDGKRLGLDLGDDEILRRYQRWRRFDAILLASVTDGLNRLFSNSLPPLKLARDLGLAAVGQVPPVKRFFMRHAMGTVGDLPRLARGEAL